MQAIRVKHRERRPASFYWLALLFGLFVLFLYGPVITIFILSFQGPEGGLTFPMRGVSLHWFAVLRDGVGDVDIWGAFGRSVRLALAVTVLTVLFSVAAGLAFRRQVSRRYGGVLCVGGQSHHAVDHRLARHRPDLPAAR